MFWKDILKTGGGDSGELSGWVHLQSGRGGTVPHQVPVFKKLRHDIFLVISDFPSLQSMLDHEILP